ncbi:MAG: Leucine efflux protein [Proteobacteria bacterium]|nr:Leucine efflux protein [Pseudomonadota bacterium]
MFDIQNYYSFIGAILLFQLIPGAGTIAILNATARNGIKAGLGAVFGTLLGDFVFMIAAILGLAAIMQQNPLLFELLQYFGAAYLCWLGVGLLRAKIESETGKIEPKKSAFVYFKQAFFVSITNPKVMLFFVAFFPLFLRPDATKVTLVAMIVHVSLISLLYQALLVLLGNSLALKLKAFPLARKIATRLAGIALIAFGIKLAINNR